MIPGSHYASLRAETPVIVTRRGLWLLMLFATLATAVIACTQDPVVVGGPSSAPGPSSTADGLGNTVEQAITDFNVGTDPCEGQLRRHPSASARAT